MRKKAGKLTVLGGGPAGLSVGYFASKKDIPITIYEANNYIGGNAITLEHRGFLFDSGAHRFHDKDPEMTEEVKNLLGKDLHKIDVPSQIYHNGKFIDFPISPLNLLKNIGLKTFLAAGLELLHERLVKKKFKACDNLENYACHKYGTKIASKFLLNYSEKLWGTPCSNLSPKVSGSRIKGLDLTTLITETIVGRKAKTRHLDGEFYYPTRGIGMLAERIADECGRENIKTNSRITKILHDHKTIQAIEVNGTKEINLSSDKVVSTLPLPLFLRLMSPSPKKELLELTDKLSYRNLMLVALFIDKDSITSNGSIYFPDSEHIFTRMYEPKNRSVHMSPPGKTSIVLEIPCQKEDELWSLRDGALVEKVANQVKKIFSIKNQEIIDSKVIKINHAYPVLEVGVEETVGEIFSYLNQFENLKISGRNGKFLYTHLHDMLRFGTDLIGSYNLEEQLPV